MMKKLAEPLVSCIMPTYNRRRFVSQAIQYFLRQDYLRKELIIVDDGTDPVKDILPEDGNIRYIRLRHKKTVGSKRNTACEEARGEIIIHWDDDDWYALHRIRCQVEALLKENAQVCGTNRLLFYDMNDEQAWEYIYTADQRLWLSGNTLCYRREYWKNHAFEDIDVGEDGLFVWSGYPEGMHIMLDKTFHVGIIHASNASPKKTTGSYWHPYQVDKIQKLIGSDWAFYTNGHMIKDCDGQLFLKTSMSRQRKFASITTAKTEDLNLPEFAAFNNNKSFPRMRCWELPFALFQSHLDNTMSVLDCTINPAGFGERLSCLYPHVLYRNWCPIQNRKFMLPLNIPDGAFDRVVCINTLEHLLKSQRETLLADLVDKLKPGGLLILTSDYYFDTFWERQEFLKIGVMRADRQEIFNGWNKVTFKEWFDFCRRHDLHPMGKWIVEPQDDDSSLYRQKEPFPHACIAGVFSKSLHWKPPAAKKVVLALLTWNTKDVSIDSLRAHIREAHMLQRLGQNPCICVCDNGSSDGTVETVRRLLKRINVPYKLICNKRNLGISHARNQIIDFMLKYDADYLLFMDGDIEIVPFSSFAMMRHMENNGHRLGCIGADSAWQTTQRECVTPVLYSVEECQIDTTNLVAWTQYGMFRREVFEEGIRFDETGPFGRVGWGFEDNDFAFQMEMKGYVNQRFFGMTYLHRHAKSSIRIMHRFGINVDDLYTHRKKYVIDKWTSVPVINDGPLEYVRQVGMLF